MIRSNTWSSLDWSDDAWVGGAIHNAIKQTIKRNKIKFTQLLPQLLNSVRCWLTRSEVTHPGSTVGGDLLKRRRLEPLHQLQPPPALLLLHTAAAVLCTPSHVTSV